MTGRVADTLGLGLNQMAGLDVLYVPYKGLLVFLFRKLDVAIKTGQPDRTVLHIVREVTRYVEFHFQSEENLMRETDYPGLQRHQDAHMELLVQLNAYMAKIAARREFPDDLLSFLNEWLARHIAHEDRMVTRHVAVSPIRPVAEYAYPEYLPSAPGSRKD